MLKLRKLNLGCGSSKISGFINIDIEPSCNPDKVCNFLKDKLPYKNDSVDEIVLFHVIEHIPKKLHEMLLKEIWRVLKPGATFLVSYPEFLKCVKNWKTNYKGHKAFWEATIFGRQLYPTDYHVCIMHTEAFKETLTDIGFFELTDSPELSESFNTIIACKKGVRVTKYEDLIEIDMRARSGSNSRTNKNNRSH